VLVGFPYLLQAVSQEVAGRWVTANRFIGYVIVGSQSALLHVEAWEHGTGAATEEKMEDPDSPNRTIPHTGMELETGELVPVVVLVAQAASRDTRLLPTLRGAFGRDAVFEVVDLPSDVEGDGEEGKDQKEETAVGGEGAPKLPAVRPSVDGLAVWTGVVAQDFKVQNLLDCVDVIATHVSHE
jgi:hypothetical protein